MISGGSLDIAVQRGLITGEQAAALRRLESEVGPAGAVAADGTDDEALRFVSGFADIFVTIGIGLFLGAIAVLVGDTTFPGFRAAVVAVTAWLLAEFFTRRRRMALPSIVLLLGFAASALLACLSGLSVALTPGSAPPVGSLFWALRAAHGAVLLPVGLLAAALTGLHYVRFRVPISIAAVVAILFLAVLGAMVSLWPDITPRLLYGAAFVWGILTFCLAMRFDLSDKVRVTRRTDIAFWLHLLAAPLIVHAFVQGLVPEVAEQPTPAAAILVLAVFMLFGLVAVIIDRRAILVSGLVYAGVAFGTLLKTSGMGDAGLLLPIVALALGAFILLLSAGWLPLRRALLGILPAGLARRLPQPMVAPSS